MKRSNLKRTGLKRSPFKLKRSSLKKYGQSTHRDYSRKPDYVKALKNKAEILWKKVCHKKYGSFCHVKRYYPHIDIVHTETIQIDHCISRANKYFFFDIRNGLPVCDSCNQAKHYKLKSVDRAIEEMVRTRDIQWYKDAVWLDQSGEANLNCSSIWWLEEKIKDLEEQLNEH